MKKVFLLLAVLLMFTFIPTAKAAYGLDFIEKYDVYVTPRNDGTLDITYNIDWKVLDSSEGGVSWVNVGVANRYIDELKLLSDDCKSISKSTSDGSCVRIDLKKEFMRNEIINIDFSIHQSRIFSLSKESKGDLNEQLIGYAFTPGWFNEIQIGEMNIYWDTTTDYYYAETDTKTNGYLTWSKKNLSCGEKMTAKIAYSQDAFPNINLEDDYKDRGLGIEWIFVIFLLSLFFLSILICIVNSIIHKFSYKTYRGFVPSYTGYHSRNYYYYRAIDMHGSKTNPKPSRSYTSSGHSGGHSGGHSCACACACACAGGGRAGCSRKDFYHIKVHKID